MSGTPPRPLPPSVRERLAKLLLMLSSPHDGERIGAVAAIERLLKSAGLDWHDLTRSIVAPQHPTQPDAREPGKHVPGHELADLIAALRANCRFNARSEEFLDSLLACARRYATVSLSPKQLAWLEDLMSRAGQ